MTYEQFLKQLRRIGRLLMIISVGVAVSNTCLIIIFSPVNIGDVMINAYIGCGFTFLVGFAIYPFKSEE